MNEGRKKALLFSVGVCITVILQTWIALLFARYLDKHPEVVDVLQKVALGIFICITLYFFFIAKDTRRQLPEASVKSKTNRFFSGMFTASLNLLPLPYWVYVSISFSVINWFSFEVLPLISAIIASGLGTFAMLALYIQFFKRKDDKPVFSINMNYIIGAITAIISIFTAIKILNRL